MSRAQGARAQMALAFETPYGTPPGSGFRQVPFASTTLGGEQPLIGSELLGYGRDPLPPVRDAFSAGGDVVIPFDVENLGLWLKAAFGAPATVGVTAAAGTIIFSAQPLANSTITINGTAFTFVASGATGNQSNIGASLAATLTALAVVLNASVVAGVLLSSYVGTATTLTVTYKTNGPAGNAFTLAASAAPASSGTPSGATLMGGANSHTFMSGNWTLPSLALETQMPEVPRFAMYSGVMVDKLSWEMQRSGLLTMTASLIAQNEVIAAATVAGTLTALNFQRFAHFNGSITRLGAALANIMSARVTYENNLDTIDSIRSDGRIEGADPSIAALSGSLDARFSDLTLYNQAVAGTPCDLAFSWTISTVAAFTFTAHAVFLPRPKAEIKGPAGVQASFDWQGALATSPARMCTAVLTNAVAGY